MAVSKTFPFTAIREAYAAGQREFGENRIQEALQKIQETADLSIRWHLIGHLQANKAKKAAQHFGTVQAVDRAELLQKLDGAAIEAERRLDVLIQVDLAGEASKHGAQPDEVPRLLELGSRCLGVRVVGLMTLPPAPESAEDSRPWFRQLRDLRDRLRDSGMPRDMLQELSMGMSGDYPVAVEEGATIVRVGTAIFGRRDVQL